MLSLAGQLLLGGAPGSEYSLRLARSAPAAVALLFNRCFCFCFTLAGADMECPVRRSGCFLFCFFFCFRFRFCFFCLFCFFFFYCCFCFRFRFRFLLLLIPVPHQRDETVQDMLMTPLYQQRASHTLASRASGPQPHMRS